MEKIKQTLYPKTKRAANNSDKFTITEKIDGSNLGLCKIEDNLFIIQRNNTYIVKYGEILNDTVTNGKKELYKGLYGWLKENILNLNLKDGSIIFGEWIGMGKIKYPENWQRFLMFAKARFNEDFTGVTNMMYQREYFKWCFEGSDIIESKMPDCIGMVPVAYEVSHAPSLAILDKLYSQYKFSQEREIEGFIVSFPTGGITKYVRHKNGIETRHST